MTAPNSSRHEMRSFSDALAAGTAGDVGVALMRTAFALRQVLQKRLGEEDPRLSPAEFALLHMLTIADGQRVGDLADATIRDRTTLTRIADRMVDKGLVERRTDPSDRRAVLLWVTQAGRAVHERLLPIRHALIERATGHLARETRDTLIRALTSIRERVLHDMGED